MRTVETLVRAEKRGFFFLESEAISVFIYPRGRRKGLPPNGFQFYGAYSLMILSARIFPRMIRADTRGQRTKKPNAITLPGG